MTVWEIPVWLVVSVLGGIKSACGTRVWNGQENAGSPVWRQRTMYQWTRIWMTVYGVTWLAGGKSPEAVRIVDFLCTCGMLALIDGKRRVVPDRILICYLAGQMILGLLCTIWTDLLSVFLKGLMFSALLLVGWWLSREKIGLGDVKLLSVTAMTAGWQYTVGLLMTALFLSFLYSIYLLFFQKKSLKAEFPFVPFLAAGAAVWMMVWARNTF